MAAHINHFRCGDTKILILLLILLFCISFYAFAGVPKRVREAFQFCYNGKDVGIDSLINTEGYYYISYPHTSILKGGGESFIFYRNGLYKKNLPAKYDSIRQQYNISLGLQEIVENSSKEESKWFYSGIWGSFVICNDTIKIQSMDKPIPLSSTFGREEWFKIIDRNTLISINSTPLSTDKSDWRNYEHYKLIRDEMAKYPAIFTSIPVKPSPDEAWILKEKWFWCNEQDWKNYMEKIKGRKKK
jgi:hypothetical protein